MVTHRCESSLISASRFRMQQFSRLSLHADWRYIGLRIGPCQMYEIHCNLNDGIFGCFIPAKFSNFDAPIVIGDLLGHK